MYMAKPHIASFELRNYSYLKSLVEAHSIPCDWNTTSGVHAYFSASLFVKARSVVERLGETHPDVAANVAVVTREEDEDTRHHHHYGGAPAYLPEAERRELTLAALRIPDAEGAIVQWHAASLWPYRLVAFVLERLLAAGHFNLQTNTPVTGLQRVGAPPAGLLAPGVAPTATWTVHTPRGAVTSRSVLLATNGYTSHLLPQFSDLIVPTRGQVAALQPPEDDENDREKKRLLPPLDIGHTFYVIGDATSDNPLSRDDYLIQRPPPPTAGAELVLGGGRRLARNNAVGIWDDATMDDPIRWWLRGALPECMDLRRRDAPQQQRQGHQEGVADEEGQEQQQQKTKGGEEEERRGSKRQDLVPTHEWTGIMGYSRDAHPWVGQVPALLGGDPEDDGSSSSAAVGGAGAGGAGGAGVRPGLFMAAGYTGHGMPNAALCGKAAAELMTGAVVPTGLESDSVDDNVEVVDLPPEYVLSEERVLRARMRVSVSEAEETGSLMFDFGSGILG
jgi:glycine/D-amino acid oxidase-like deaminating enzyme